MIEFDESILLAYQSLKWFVERYPEDKEITAHRIHLRKLEDFLKKVVDKQT